MLSHGVLGGLMVFTQLEVVHSQLAPAYRVDGAGSYDKSYSQIDGTYYRAATAQCNGKPEYQLGGSALFQHFTVLRQI